MSLLSRYVVPCITENASIVSDYRYDPPTVCPNNNTHVIDTNGIYIFNSIVSKTVVIKQDGDVSTGGYYRADQFEISIPAGTGATASYDISYPYNVCVYSVIFLPSPDNIGDTYHIISFPDTPVGLLTNSLNIGDNSLSIANISQLNPGFNVSVTDGINTDDLGVITSVDEVTNSITFSNPTTNPYAIGSTLSISIPRLLNGKFPNSNNLNLGFSRIGSAGLPAGRIVRVNYVNNNGIAKTLNLIVEIQF